MHSIFFDNSFSSYQLLHDLTIQGFRAIWTMRNYRIIKCVKETDLIKNEKKALLTIKVVALLKLRDRMIT